MLAGRYRAHDPRRSLDAAARGAHRSERLRLGRGGRRCRQVVRPQLEKLGLPIEVVEGERDALARDRRVTWPILRPGRASPLP